MPKGKKEQPALMMCDRSRELLQDAWASVKEQHARLDAIARIMAAEWGDGIGRSARADTKALATGKPSGRCRAALKRWKV